MTNWTVAALAGALAALLPGAAAQAQRMQGFEALASRGDRIDVSGIGFGERGSFRLGDGGSTGRYHRSSSASADPAMLDEQPDGDPMWIARAGGSAFDITDAAVGGRLTGRCRFFRGEERTRFGALSISDATAPLQYRCTFERNGGPAGTLELQARFTRKLSVTSERTGRVRFGTTELTLQSVHRLGRHTLPTAMPVGYVMSAGGAPVAAIDLNGATRARLVLPRETEQRQAALAASLALAFLWDPGDGED